MSVGIIAGTGAPLRLHSRSSVLAALRRTADRQGRGGAAMVVEGAYGSGKSVLLEQLSVEVGLPTLDLVGLRSERDIPFAGLNRLFPPRGTPLLPEFQVDEAEPVVWQRVWRELGRLLDHGPLLLRVDDAHLLDPPSLRVLALLARRIERLPALLVLTSEPRHELQGQPLEGIPSSRLAPLDFSDGMRLLYEHARFPPSPEVAEELVAGSEGNPLALVELARALTAPQSLGLAPSPLVPPHDGGFRVETRRRLWSLPDLARELVMLTVVDERLDHEDVLAAAPLAAADPDAWSTATCSGLVELGESGPRPAGELRRRCLETDACPGELRRARLSLARGLEGRGRHTRALRHRAEVSADSPERLATELERTAREAESAGEYARASRLYERAAALSDHDESKGNRILAAGHDAWTGGEPRRALAMTRRAHTLVRSAGPRGMRDLLRGGVELCDGKPATAVRELTEASSALLDTDRELAITALMLAGDACCVTGDYREYYELASRAEWLRSPEDSYDTALILRNFTAMSATFRGRHEVAAPALREVIRMADRATAPAPLVLAGNAAFTLGDPAVSYRLATRAQRTAEERGETVQLPWASVYVSLSALLLERYAEAESSALEGVRLSRALGQRNRMIDHLALLALVAALRGEPETVELRLAQATEHGLLSRGLGRPDAFYSWAAACAELAHGRPVRAVHRLRLMDSGIGGFNPAVRVLAAPHFVEAAVSCGERDDAVRLLGAFDHWVGSTRSITRMALSHRCHALLAERAADADERFRAAIEAHRESGGALELARTELLYAGRLRRARKPAAARELLDEAGTIFDEYGAEPWSRRVRAELRATGRSVSTRSPGPVNELTARQTEISRLVAEGATNREIAELLYVSDRTVEHHLRNVFVKLGVRSRTELAKLLR
ncbi:LuxR C-terminal-related transcriptional regulator [Actinopolyspora sp. H202]|uniref:LuxR C-terminal-related transcriptional regulator n=1 Tax=Actinopolyspora sp. H202 TaxID=1500456 RepID=UPI003EE56551